MPIMVPVTPETPRQGVRPRRVEAGFHFAIQGDWLSMTLLAGGVFRGIGEIV